MSTLGKFWKIILSCKWSLLIQFAIFIGIAVAFAFFASSNDGAVEEFENIEEVPIAIFDYDQTELTQKFVSFMTDLHEIVEVENSEEAWLDAITWAEVFLIIEIPLGFTDSLLFGDNEVQIGYLENQNSATGFLVREQVECYFGIWSTYLAGGFDISEADELVFQTLRSGVEIEVVRFDDVRLAEAYVYFRFLPISLIIVVAIAMGAVFLALGKQEVVHRMKISPVSYHRMMTERIIACVTFGVLAWAIFIAISSILIGNVMLEIENLVRIANSFLLVLLGIAFAFVITRFMKKREMLISVTSSTVMILSIAGIMFDLSILGEQVLAVARFTPIYWYSRINDMLQFESVIDWTLVWQGIVIQIAFASMIIAVGLVFNKERKRIK